MQGILVWSSLAAAVKAGFEVCDRTRDGYLVRAHTPSGWALAVVERDPTPLPQPPYAKR